MKFFTLFILILITNYIYSQGVVNSSANIVVSSGAYIYIDGNANGGYTNTGTGEIESDGTISLEGDWINNGSGDVFVNRDNTGDVVFTGSSDQELGGSHKTVFENLTVNNGQKVYLTQNIDINYNLTLTSGKFDLKDKITDLGANGDIVNETETNSITSTDGSGIVGNNTGTITATRTVNGVTNYNPAHLGIEITTTANLGSITIIRGHKIQTGSFGGAATSGVARYYEVPGIGKLDVAAGIKVNMYYWDAELNGATESQIEGYHWVTEGSSSSWWTPLDGSVNTSSNLFTTAGNPYGNYFTTSTWYGFTWSDKFTLGSKDNPLPVELTSFKADCESNGVNVSWTTASEKNNDYFTLERSTDMSNFKTIANINGNGTINQTSYYNYFDNQKNSIIYYKLSQYDYNGDKETFKTIATSCNDNFNSSDIAINYSNNNIEVFLPDNNASDYKIYLIDNIGRQITTQQETISENKISLSNLNLAKGIYNLVLTGNNNRITKKILINY